MTDADPVNIVVAGYDRLARRWDRWTDSIQPPLRERYLDWLDERLLPGSSVLELGSGTGRPVAERLASRHEYLGVDASPEMVAVATGNVPAGRFAVAEMRQLDLPTSEFDVVVAFYSIIHVPRTDQSALFHEIHRWLRPGGYFVACLSSGDLPVGEEDDWLGAGRMFWSGYDADTNRQLLKNAGFDLIEASVLSQMEGDEEVQFLWVLAQA
ncbi:MAG TPA: class I SAM-dependent methyltransferase [Acidimicrobiia bacterium]|nr:class I SAM-dependent methyltransferase [Acidimicrobiia bacterium]